MNMGLYTFGKAWKSKRYCNDSGLHVCGYVACGVWVERRPGGLPRILDPADDAKRTCGRRRRDGGSESEHATAYDGTGDLRRRNIISRATQ